MIHWTPPPFLNRFVFLFCILINCKFPCSCLKSRLVLLEINVKVGRILNTIIAKYDWFALLDKTPYYKRQLCFKKEFENLEFYTEKCCANSFPKSFSFGCITPRVDYIHWTTYIYTSDKSLYQAHLLHQFKRACEVVESRFIFVSSAQSERLTAHGRMLMEDNLQLKKSDNLQEIKLYIFELNLQ